MLVIKLLAQGELTPTGEREVQFAQSLSKYNVKWSLFKVFFELNGQMRSMVVRDNEARLNVTIKN